MPEPNDHGVILARQIEELKAKLTLDKTLHDQELLKYKREVERLQLELQDSKIKRNQAIALYEERQHVQEQTLSVLKTTKQDLFDSKVKIGQLELQVQESQNHGEIFKSQLATAQREQDRLRQEIDSIVKDRDAIEENFRQYREKSVRDTRKLENDLQRARSEAAAAEQSVSYWSTSFQDKNRELQESTRRIRELEFRCKNIEAGFVSDIEMRQREAELLQKEALESRARILELEEVRNRLEQILAENDSRWEVQIEQLRREKEEYDAEIGNLRAQLHEAEKLLQTKNENISVKLDDNQLNQPSSQLEILSGTAAVADRIITSGGSFMDIINENNSLKSEIAAKEQQSAFYRQSFEHVLEEIRNNGIILNEQYRVNALLKEENEKLSLQLSQIKEEMESFKRQAQESNSVAELNKNEHSILKKLNSDLHKQVQSLLLEVKRLRYPHSNTLEDLGKPEETPEEYITFRGIRELQQNNISLIRKMVVQEEEMRKQVSEIQRLEEVLNSQEQEFEGIIAKMQLQLESLVEQRDTATQKNDELRRLFENHGFSDSGVQCAAENQVQEITKEVTRLQELLRSLNVQYDKLENAYTTEKQIRQQKEDAINTLLEQIRQRDQELQDQKNHQEEILQQQQAAQRDSANLREALAYEQRTVQRLVEEKDAIGEEKNQLRRQLLQQEETYRRELAESKSSQHRLAEATLEVERLKEEIRSLHDTVAHQRAKFEMAEQEREEMQGRTIELEQLISELRVSVRELTKEKESLEESLARLETIPGQSGMDVDVDRSSIDFEQAEELMAVRLEHEHQLGVLRAEVDSILAIVAELENQISSKKDIEELLRSKEEILQTLRANIETQEQRSKELMTQNIRIKLEKDKLAEEVRKKAEEVKKAQEEMASITKKLEDSSKEAGEKSETISKLQADLQAENQKVAQLSQHCTLWKDTLGKMREKLRQAETEKGNTANELTQMRAEKDRLQTAIQKLQVRSLDPRQARNSVRDVRTTETQTEESRLPAPIISTPQHLGESTISPTPLSSTSEKSQTTGNVVSIATQTMLGGQVIDRVNARMEDQKAKAEWAFMNIKKLTLLNKKFKKSQEEMRQQNMRLSVKVSQVERQNTNLKRKLQEIENAQTAEGDESKKVKAG
ncbi:uncharacterized protein VTP21DRAFT_10374 [Calcarisporiella thermophila]|uniref:uncharacterized protein n=1 Tax=Calcarisporiella thermophila TaxID=911321 RepID=UPI003743F436